MKYIEYDLNNILKITMLNKSKLNDSTFHITRIVDCFIMYAISDGCLKIKNNDELLELREGDIYFFKKGDFQKPVGTSNCEFYYVHFDTNPVNIYDYDMDTYFKKTENKQSGFKKANAYSTQPYNYISALLPQKMHVENKEFFVYFINTLKNNTLTGSLQSPEHRLKASYSVASLLMKLENIYYNSKTNKNIAKLRIANNVKLISDYIEANCLNDISGTDVEKKLLINFDYANRIFKKVMGITIMKYRNKLRIDAAKNLLSVTEYSMEQIAEKTGFCNKYYFAKCFKSIEGITPTDYKFKIKGVYEDEKNI